MKGYRVIRRSSGLVFACDKCDRRIELAQFGNQPRARTLGAAAMNKHLAEAHPDTVNKAAIVAR